MIPEVKTPDARTPDAVARAADRLRRAGLDPVVEEVHRRFGDGEPASITLRRLSEAQRTAIADLLGAVRLPRDPTRLPVPGLTAALGLASTAELRAAVELLRGPVVDRAALRLAAAVDRADVWRWLEQQLPHLDVVTDPGAFLAGLQRAGVRGSPDRHREWLGRVLAVLAALPADGVTLAELAQDVLGHPHALDAGRSVAAAVLDAVGLATAGRRDAEATRAAWESVGVAPDALSSTVLALGLVADPEHPFGPWWQRAAADSEPTVHTLSQLRRWPVPPLSAAAHVFVVENPSLVVAAARTGWAGPPIVCSSGRPTVAVLTLVRQLTSAGATAYQHADFDPAGLGITSWLAARCGTVPWRMSATDYQDVLGRRARDPVADDAVVPLTPWDLELQETMDQSRTWIYEEELRDELLDGIRAPSTTTG